MAQLVIRGLLILLMGFGFLLNSESDNINRIIPYLGSGIYGSCFVVTLGRMMEAGLQVTSCDDFVECFFNIVGIILNVVFAGSTFHEFSQSHGFKRTVKETLINKGMISIMAGVLYMMDIASLHCCI